MQLSYLLRPNAAVREQIDLDRSKKLMGVGQLPTIGVHIPYNSLCDPSVARSLGRSVPQRHGQCQTLTEHIPEIRAHARRYKTDRVFLATLDRNIIEQARIYEGEFTFFFLNSFDANELRANITAAGNGMLAKRFCRLQMNAYNLLCIQA